MLTGFLQGLSRPLVEADLTRLLYYASRIRYFGKLYDSCHTPTVVQFKAEVFSALAALIGPQRKLLPNLRELDWGLLGWAMDVDDSPFLFLQYILPSRLNKATLFIDRGDKAQRASALAMLNDCVVKHLTIHHGTAVTAAVSQVVCRQTELHSLKALTLAKNTWMHLAQQTHLQSLELPWATTMPRFSGRVFPALRDLHLHSNVSALLNLLLALDRPPLARAIFWINVSPNPGQWLEFFTGLADHLSHKDLVELWVQITEPGRGIDMILPLVRALMPSVIRPLLVFSRLTSLHVTPGIWDLDNDSLVELALAFPMLEHLHLISRSFWHYYLPYPRVTLRGLLPLVQHCENLTSLGLELDATLGADELEDIPSSVRNNTLLTLKVGDSRIEDALPVAQFLTTVFRNPQVRVEWDRGPSLYTKKWQEVGVRLDTFKGRTKIVS